MFDNLPEDLNKLIMKFYFSGSNCCFCKKTFLNGYLDKDSELNCCADCGEYVMYERGSESFFQNKRYIKWN